MTLYPTEQPRTSRLFRPRGVSRLSALLLLSVTLSMAGPCAFASSARKTTLADGPEVVIGSTRRDFGDVFAGEELEQNFPVRNAGNKPLELSQRSTLGTRSSERRYPVTEAVWRTNDQLVARTVAARPAAPS